MIATDSFQEELDDLLHRIARQLQISPTMHETAEERYRAIGEWLEAPDSPLRDLRPRIYSQGSLSTGTTVKPLARQEYDLDLVCELELLDWRRVSQPVQLLNVVETRLREHGQYRQMLERKNRCIRIRYANEFHLDILPGCPDPSAGAGCIVVPDRRAQSWKASNPRGYVEWFENRAKLFQAALAKRMAPLPGWEPGDLKPPLKIVVQLLKRWRDITYSEVPEKAPISIVLTTLAAGYYTGEQSVGGALSVVLGQIVDAIETRKSRLVVLNPTNHQEDLSERWSDASRYASFCSGVRKLNDVWGDLLKHRGTSELVGILGALFGKLETTKALTERAAEVEKARAQGRLGVRRASGVLGMVAGGSSVQVPRNTFYGG